VIKSRMIQLSPELGVEFAWCPPGGFSLFTRGTSLFYKTKLDKVEVNFTKGFWISRLPVTIALWNTVLGMHHRFHIIKNHKLPVYGIDFREAVMFLSNLKERLALAGYDPSSVNYPNYLEYQHACEAKTTKSAGPFWTDVKDFGNYCWFLNNSGNTVHEAGLKLPNPWGLYDMYGNILDICLDVKAKPAQQVITDPQSSFDNITALGGHFSKSFLECSVMEQHGAVTKENEYVEPLGLRLIYKQ